MYGLMHQLGCEQGKQWTPIKVSLHIISLPTHQFIDDFQHRTVLKSYTNGSLDSCFHVSEDIPRRTNLVVSSQIPGSSRTARNFPCRGWPSHHTPTALCGARSCQGGPPWHTVAAYSAYTTCVRGHSHCLKHPRNYHHQTWANYINSNNTPIPPQQFQLQNINSNNKISVPNQNNSTWIEQP